MIRKQLSFLELHYYTYFSLLLFIKIADLCSMSFLTDYNPADFQGIIFNVKDAVKCNVVSKEQFLFHMQARVISIDGHHYWHG